MDEVMIVGCLGYSDHEVGEFQITGDSRKSTSKTLTLNMGRADFWLLKELVSKVPWESTFEGISTEESNSKVPEVKEMEQKASLAEQVSSSRT